MSSYIHIYSSRVEILVLFELYFDLFNIRSTNREIMERAHHVTQGGMTRDLL